MITMMKSLYCHLLLIKLFLGDMYKHAGVAITVTTLTDVLAFGISASSNYISVRTFCIYTGNFYSWGLSTATIEYSCLPVCLSVCVSVCLSVYTITQKIIVQST